MGSSMLYRCRHLAIGFCVSTLVVGTVPASAQIETGNIVGAVFDETKSALPGATVTVVNLANGQERVVRTNERGRYQATALQPGRYSVTTELQGFATVKREVTVNVGSTVDVDVDMRIAGVAETLTVTGEAPLVQSKKTDLSSVIGEQELEALPSKGRQYLDFAALLPTSTESVTRFQGTGAVIGGARSKEGTLLVDGFYNLDEMFTQPKQRHSQDAIQEFQVVTFGGSAEYGRAIGGVINAVTKSGGNDVKGTGYGFFRDKNLNAQDFAEKQRGTPKSDFSRQQWGGTVGGPIKVNRSFYFGAYERVVEDIPFDNGIRPSDGAIVGLPAGDVGTVPRFWRLNFAMGKWDHNLNANQRLQASYSMSRWTDHGYTTTEPLTTRSAGSLNNLFATDHALMGKWMVIARDGKMMHELKASYSPRYYGIGGVQEGGPPLVPEGQINKEGVRLTNASPPRVTIAGVAIFGRAGLAGEVNTFPSQVVYTSSLFADKHAIKFGVDYMYAILNATYFSGLAGAYSFASLDAFRAGRYSTYSQSFGDPYNPRTHQYLSGFLQDSWQANNRLTLNYGLRYDVEFNPEQRTSGIAFGNDYNNVGPRFAMSYDVTNKGTTFLKLTSGLYYDRLWANITGFYTSLKGYELVESATWTPTSPGAPIYPNVFAQKPTNLPRSVVNASIMPSDVQVPANAQLVASLEHAIGPDLAVTGSMIYSRAWNKEYTWDTNLEWEESTQRWIRPDPNYRSINQIRFGGPAEYVGSFVEVTKRGARFGFDGNLTVARSYETPVDAGGISGTINDQRLGIQDDYGPAPDVPTVRGVVNGRYDVNPSIQLSGIYRARTGIAVNPIAQGLDLNGDQKFGDRTPTLRPYSFRAPGINSLDARFTWRIPLRSSMRLMLSVESFNLLNTKNVRTVLNNFGPDPARPDPRWLEPAGYLAPREVQLGARLTF
jgi:hypothetical protein